MGPNNTVFLVMPTGPNPVQISIPVPQKPPTPGICSELNASKL